MPQHFITSLHFVTKCSAGSSVGIIMLMLSACAGTSSNLQPLTEKNHDFAKTETEINLLDRSNTAHSDLERKGLILGDPIVSEYITRVGEGVSPSIFGKDLAMRFYVLKDPAVNAMAFPNGNIYINVGLMVRLENEAQLAHVLSHEVAHVVQRHSLKGAINHSSTVVAAHVTDLLLFGTSIAYLPYISSLSGFSQEQELESDEYALKYMYGANYDVNESVNVFEILQQTETFESVKGSIYSSHPTNELRIQTSKELIHQLYRAQPKAKLGNEQFRMVRKKIERLNLKLKLSSQKYQMTVRGADRAIANNSDDPWVWYYKAEAYRLMAKYPKSAGRERAWIKGSSQNVDKFIAEIVAQKNELLSKAADALSAGENRFGELPQFHRCRGLIAYDTGDFFRAKQELQKYLDSGEKIKDKLYIDKLMTKMGG